MCETDPENFHYFTGNSGRNVTSRNSSSTEARPAMPSVSPPPQSQIELISDRVGEVPSPLPPPIVLGQNPILSIVPLYLARTLRAYFVFLHISFSPTYSVGSTVTQIDSRHPVRSLLFSSRGAEEDEGTVRGLARRCMREAPE